MNAEQFLRQYRDAKHDLQCENAKMNELNRIAEGLQDDELIQMIDDSKVVMKAKIERLLSKMETVSETINLVKDARAREILTRRYIGLERWEMIAVAMNFDYSYMVDKLKKDSLEKINKIINN